MRDRATESQLLEEILSGKERIWRFSESEQISSSDSADRFLWLAILRAECELAATIFGGDAARSAEAVGRTPPPYRFLNSLAQPLPSTFSDLIGLLGQYEDRGQESIVCNAGDGFINKLRPMRISSLSGYLAPLANIVYHNCLFPNERYTLENIYVQDQKFFMVIDADSGQVRFIDPRITLNDPNGPITPVSQFGKRREDFPGQIFI